MNKERVEYYKHLDFIKLLTYATNSISVSHFKVLDDLNPVITYPKFQIYKKKQIPKLEYFRRLLSFALFDQMNIYDNQNIIIPLKEIQIEAEKKGIIIPYLSNLIKSIFIPSENLFLFISDTNVSGTEKYSKIINFDYKLKVLPSNILLNIYALKKYVEYFYERYSKEIDLSYNTIILTKNNPTSFSTHSHIVINPVEAEHYNSIGLLYHEVGHNILLHLVYPEVVSQMFSKFLEVFNKSVSKDFYGEIYTADKLDTSITQGFNFIDKVDKNSVRKSDILEVRYFLEILKESAYNVLYNKSFTMNVIYDVFVNYYAKKNGFEIANIEEIMKDFIFNEQIEKQIEQLIILDRYQIVINSSLYYSMDFELRQKAYEILNSLLDEVYNEFKGKVKDDVLNYYRLVLENFKLPYESDNNPFRRAKQFQMSGIAFEIANRINQDRFYFLQSLGDNSGILKMKRILNNYFGFVFQSNYELKNIKKVSDSSIEKILRGLIVYMLNFPDLEKNRKGRGITGTHLVFRVFDIFQDLNLKEKNVIQSIKRKYLMKYFNEVISKYFDYHRNNISNIFNEVDIILNQFIKPNKENFRLDKIKNTDYFTDLIDRFNTFVRQNSLNNIMSFYRFSFYHYLYFLNKITFLQKEDFEDFDFDENFKIYLRMIDYLAEITKALFRNDKNLDEILKPSDKELTAKTIFEEYYKKINEELLKETRKQNIRFTKRVEYINKIVASLEVAYRREIENKQIDSFLYLFNSGVYFNWVINFSF